MKNLEIRSTHWKRGKSLTNAINYYRTVLPIILSQRRNIVIFSHMTEVQSFLIAPLCRLLKIRHFLWYAHKNRSKYLKLALPFLSGIITSTPGSCPIKGPKVHAIGQAIDHNLFSVADYRPKNPPSCWYHVGRMDKSKHIDLMIDVFRQLRKNGWNLTLHLYGDISTQHSENYPVSSSPSFLSRNNSSWLTFHGPIERAKIPEIARHHDGFVHAFQGSLDKAVLEAVMCRRVVVSINPEFEAHFCSSTSTSQNLFDRLMSQLLKVLKMSEVEQNTRIEEFYNTCRRNHSLDKWINDVVEVITN
jgi:glycosyltransferase involved in cell wall biosynthesis